jgi:hypothetical protein
MRVRGLVADDKDIIKYYVHGRHSHWNSHDPPLLSFIKTQNLRLQRAAVEVPVSDTPVLVKKKKEEKRMSASHSNGSVLPYGDPRDTALPST